MFEPQIRRLLSPMRPIPTNHPFKLVKLKGIKAVILDVYGTMLVSAAGDVGPDEAENSEEAFRAALIDSGLKIHPPQMRDGIMILQDEISLSHQKSREKGVDYPEIDIMNIWKRVIARLSGGSVTPSLKVLRYLALDYECRVNPVWPMPELVPTLENLQKRKIKLGIISNAQFFTELIFCAVCGRDLRRLGFSKDICCWSFQQGRGKPSPMLFQLIKHRLIDAYAIRPHQTLYVGNDMLKDIQPAAAAGWKTALFAGDRRSLKLRENDERCRSTVPDLVIDSLGQLCSQLP